MALGFERPEVPRGAPELFEHQLVIRDQANGVIMLPVTNCAPMRAAGPRSSLRWALQASQV